MNEILRSYKKMNAELRIIIKKTKINKEENRK